MIKVLLIIAIGSVNIVGTADDMTTCRVAALSAMEALIPEGHTVNEIYTDDKGNLQITINKEGWVKDTAGYISCQKVEL